MPTHEEITALINPLIASAEELFGPRNATKTLLALAYHNGQPFAAPVGDAGIQITLRNSCLAAQDNVSATYDLAHELIHYMGPGAPGTHATKLEEGCANYFAQYYVRKKNGVLTGPADANYIEALDLFKQLMVIDPILIKTIRINKPAFSSITAVDLTATNAGFPPDLAAAITAPFI